MAAAVSGGVSVYTSKKDREALDKRLQAVDLPMLDLQREQWEHQKTADDRKRERASYDDLLSVFSDMASYADKGFTEASTRDEHLLTLLRRASDVLVRIRIDGSGAVHHFGQRTVNAYTDLIAGGSMGLPEHHLRMMREQWESETHTVQAVIREVLTVRRTTYTSAE